MNCCICLKVHNNEVKLEHLIDNHYIDTLQQMNPCEELNQLHTQPDLPGIECCTFCYKFGCKLSFQSF
jgi:hypothetical protein